MSKRGWAILLLFYWLLAGCAGADTSSVHAVESSSSSGLMRFGEGMVSSKMAFSLDGILGAGGKVNGIQSFAFDERSRQIYSLNLEVTKRGIRSTVNRYPLDGGESKASLGFSQPLGDVVGHQGLGLEYLKSGGLRLWGTYYKDLRKVVRYSYSDGAPVRNVQIYKLFGKDYRSYVSATPAISLDQKFLIAAGRKKGVDYQTIRVWKISDLVRSGGGDFSRAWVHEWKLEGVGGPDYPLQGIASDGSRIWIIAGSSKIDMQKRLFEYSMRGEKLDQDLDVSLGRQQALRDGKGSIYEPEGLALLRLNGRVYLCVGIVSGDRGDRFARIYKMPVEK